MSPEEVWWSWPSRYTPSKPCSSLRLPTRLLRPRKPADFLTSFLYQCLQYYTGNPFLLLWILLPYQYSPLLHSLTKFQQLTSLLLKLPRLQPHSSWSPCLMADLPLSGILQVSGPVKNLILPEVNKIPLRYLVCDVLVWGSISNVFLSPPWATCNCLTR